MLNELFIETASFPEVDEYAKERARELFDNYKKRNVLINCEFDDESWTITDEYSVIGLNFRFVEFSYRRFYEKQFDMPLSEFTDCVKCFTTTLLGKYAPGTIRDFLNDIRKLITTSPTSIMSGTANLSLFSTNNCVDFLNTMPNERYYDFIEKLETGIKRQDSNQRSLAAYDSYFLFEDILNDFWTMDLDKGTRLFYYPLYLWWQLTAVIPFRPREFLLTSRNCLEKRADGYWLTVRKNQLKGRRKRTVKYKINEDYYEKQLRITDKLGNEIQQYIDWTNEYDATDIDTLFIAEPHYAKWDRKKSKVSRFYTMQNLYTSLRYFYSEVIEGIYKFKTVEKTDHLRPGEICRINLGDTRHLSLINIMLEGGSIELVMELAGHEEIETTMHYASNVDEFWECRTHRQYRLVHNGKTEYKALTFFNPSQDAVRLSDGNLCISKEYARGSISECLKAAGTAGELCYCSTNCRYYRIDGEPDDAADKRHKERIKESWELLAKAVEVVRKEKGYEETIGEELNKLQAQVRAYSEMKIRR